MRAQKRSVPPRRLRVARCPAADIEAEWHAKVRGEIERALTGRRPKLVADLDLHATETLGTLEKVIRRETVRDDPEPT